ncbi:MAG: hypothetical protein GTO18_16095 [Anaerolineales bacterium]|nr:hypothetical protein [Anaerolineales bacterium]
MKKTFSLISLIILIILPVTSVFGQGTEGDLDAAIRWLEQQQQEDGGFSNGFAPESDIGTTADAVLVMVQAGSDPANLEKSGYSPLDFLAKRVYAGEVESPGVIAKVILAVNAVGIDPREFGGADLVEVLLGEYDVSTGFFGMGPFDSALAILALEALDEALPEGVIESVLATRYKDGSYSFNADPTITTGDSNTTSFVVQALIAAGEEDRIDPSMSYFAAVQNEDNGWTFQKPSEFGEETDTNSTSLAMQALDAAEEDLSDWGDPLVALVNLQEPSGGFSFSESFRGENILATIQAIPVLAGATYLNPTAPSTIQESLISEVALVIFVLLLAVLTLAYIVVRVRSRASS